MEVCGRAKDSLVLFTCVTLILWALRTTVLDAGQSDRKSTWFNYLSPFFFPFSSSTERLVFLCLPPEVLESLGFSVPMAF